MGRRLLKEREVPELVATLHRVEGTELRILELMMWGHAYASHYYLLRRPLPGPEKVPELREHPDRYGRRLHFGPDLAREGEELSYLGE